MIERVTRRGVLRSAVGASVASAIGAVNVVGADEGDTAEPTWQFGTDGRIRSSPTVVDGTVYAGSNDGHLYAIDADEGEQRWSVEIGEAVRSSPNVVDGTVHVGSDDGRLYAIDADDGEQLWSAGTRAPVESSPTVVDGVAYVGSDDSRVYAFDDEGERLWRFDARTQGFAGPIVNSAPVRGAPVVVDDVIHAFAPGAGYGIEVGTGEEQWAHQFDEDELRSSPTRRGSTVYVGSGNALYALNANRGGARWSFTTQGLVESSPTVADDRLYVGSNEGRLFAFNATTGSLRWRFEAGEPVRSSPTVVDGTVYVGTDEGVLYGIDADDGEETVRFEPGTAIVSSPVVVDGRLYVGCDDTNVYAIDLETDGSSGDTRVAQGILGHHHVWAGDPSPDTVVSDDPEELAGDDHEEDADDEEGDDEATVDGEEDDDDEGDDGTDGGEEVETEPTEDDDGGRFDSLPGPGIVGAAASIGGASYLLARRRRGARADRDDPDDAT